MNEYTRHVAEWELPLCGSSALMTRTKKGDIYFKHNRVHGFWWNLKDLKERSYNRSEMLRIAQHFPEDFI